VGVRILVIGAGAVGGYFGGRLLQAGRDVTFLVRSQRASELANSGLVIQSNSGNATLRDVRTVLAENLRDAFDLVLLSCKAYDLDNAMASFAPAVRTSTTILPLLNGMRHLDILDARFGRSRVLGGQCVIAATLNRERAIVHLNDLHSLTFGEREGGISPRTTAINAEFEVDNIDAKVSEAILQDMWEKWMFLAAAAGSTSLFRAPIGDILAAPEGGERMLALWRECCAVGEANGYAPRAAAIERSLKLFTAVGSPMTASMLRDIENNARTEADHVVGDLIARATAAKDAAPDVPMLRLVYTHLKAYEARRARTLA
jgi:2-dehydropantoate 2-reductase